NYGVSPLTIPPVGIDGSHPALGRSPFDLFQWIITLHFENQMTLGVGFQTDEEVGEIVVHLAVMKIRDGEAQTLILSESGHVRMLVDKVRGLLFPFLRVEHY